MTLEAQLARNFSQWDASLNGNGSDAQKVLVADLKSYSVQNRIFTNFAPRYRARIGNLAGCVTSY